MDPPPSLVNSPTLSSLVRAFQSDWYEAVRLLQYRPSLANEQDPFGSLALHFAAMYRASPEVVTLLLRINPEAAKRPNKSKYLPVHYAAGNGAPPECVALIWHANRDGGQQRNGAGMTPLDLATQHNRCAPTVNTACISRNIPNISRTRVPQCRKCSLTSGPRKYDCDGC